MQKSRRFIALFVLVLAVVAVIGGPALAQELPKLRPSDPPQGGICAPWHRCIAYAGLGMSVIVVGIFGLGYLVQSRGFDRLQHRQGNPEGVQSDKS